MSVLLSRYCTLLLPELQASEDSHGAFILRSWSSIVYSGQIQFPIPIKISNHWCYRTGVSAEIDRIVQVENLFPNRLIDRSIGEGDRERRISCGFDSVKCFMQIAVNG